MADGSNTRLSDIRHKTKDFPDVFILGNFMAQGWRPMETPNGSSVSHTDEGFLCVVQRWSYVRKVLYADGDTHRRPESVQRTNSENSSLRIANKRGKDARKRMMMTMTMMMTVCADLKGNSQWVQVSSGEAYMMVAIMMKMMNMMETELWCWWG